MFLKSTFVRTVILGLFGAFLGGTSWVPVMLVSEQLELQRAINKQFGTLAYQNVHFVLIFLFVLLGCVIGFAIARRLKPHETPNSTPDPHPLD